MKKKLVTNNPLVKEKFDNKLKVEFYDIDYLKILEKVRDMIHTGNKLLSHPLSGSVKPNETPYKTVIISENKGHLDIDSLMIIEQSISTTTRFMKDEMTPDWNERIREDFQTIDLSLIENVLRNMI